MYRPLDGDARCKALLWASASSYGLLTHQGLWLLLGFQQQLRICPEPRSCWVSPSPQHQTKHVIVNIETNWSNFLRDFLSSRFKKITKGSDTVQVELDCVSSLVEVLCFPIETKEPFPTGAKYSSTRGDASHAPGGEKAQNHRRRSEKSNLQVQRLRSRCWNYCVFFLCRRKKPSSFYPGCNDRDEVISTPRQESYSIYISIQWEESSWLLTNVTDTDQMNLLKSERKRLNYLFVTNITHYGDVEDTSATTTAPAVPNMASRQQW